jgi:putative endonuclease
MTKSAHLLVGSEGEATATSFLQHLGYEIRGRNIRIGRDEVDILAFDPEDQVLVFAEVKTRSRLHEDYRPELNADWKKCAKLRRSARRWVAEHNYDGGYRLDLICVADGNITNHVKELSWE